MSKKDLIKLIKDNYVKSSLQTITFFELRRDHYQLEQFTDKQLFELVKQLDFDMFGQSGFWGKIKRN